MADAETKSPPREDPPADDNATAQDPPAELDDEDIKSRKVTLADLSAKGATLYAHKSFEEAAEIFSEASNLQADINGETAPENAEILFHYGRSLFKVGQGKSNVLGGSAPVEKKKPANGKAAAGKPAPKVEASKDADEKKGLFQFTGDENFDSESDEDEQEEEDEEEDELSIAFEVLDLARVCYVKQLDTIEQQDQTEGKGKEAAGEDYAALRHIKERLADTHDALSEISLENEKYPNAIEDGRKSLSYKLQLYPEDSEVIAEAHFKLSLAMEFASMTTTGVAGSGAPQTEDMDQALRDQAVEHMELALKSFRLKMQSKEVELASMASPEDNELSRKEIQEMKDVISDMEQRLKDLKDGPIDTKALLGDGANPLGGLFGAEGGAAVEEAKKTATDLTGLVRKKKPADKATGGKRKAEEEAVAEGESPKKAKVEDD